MMSLETKSFSLEELAKHHEQTQSVVHRYVTEVDYLAMAAKAQALDRLIVKAQKMIAAHLPDPDADDKALVSKLIALFDGEEQRKAQCSMPVDCLREVKAHAGRDGFIAGYILCNEGSPLIKHNYEGFADQYSDSIRKGLE